MRLWIFSGRQCQKTLENSLLGTAYQTSLRPKKWEDTSLWQLFEPSRRSEKAPPHSHWRKTLQLCKMLVLKCWILPPQYWRLSDLKWPPDKGRVEVVDGDLCVLVAQQDGLFCHQPAPSCKLIASHQLERLAPSCFHPHQGLLLPSTFLQLSHPGLDWLLIMVSPLL